MAVVRTQDKTFEAIVVTDDAGADISESITFAEPTKICSVQVEKPAAGTLTVQVVTVGGPTTLLGSCTLVAADTTFYTNDENPLLASTIDSLLITSTGTGAGTSVAIIAQNMMNNTGRTY